MAGAKKKAAKKTVTKKTAGAVKSSKVKAAKARAVEPRAGGPKARASAAKGKPTKAKAAKAGKPTKAARAVHPAGKEAYLTPPRLPEAIVLGVDLAATPAEVFRRVTSAKGLTSWLALSAADAGRVGASFRVEVLPGLEVQGKVAAFDAPRRLAIDLEGAPPTRLELLVAAGARAGRSRLTLRHEGFRGDAGVVAFQRFAGLWPFTLANLRSVLLGGLDRRGHRRSILRAITISASPERVYKALIDPVDLARWQCTRADVDPREGGRFLWDWAGTPHAESMGGTLYAEGVLLAYDPPRLLELAYHVPKFKKGEGRPTAIEFTLERAGDATRLALGHAGFDMHRSWDGYFDGHRESWDADLVKLARLCERGDPGHVMRLEAAVAADEDEVLEALARAAGGRVVERSSGGGEGRRAIIDLDGPKVRANAKAGKGARAKAAAPLAGERVYAHLERRGDGTALVACVSSAAAPKDEKAARAAWTKVLRALKG